MRNSTDWAEDLVRMGYAALVVDHFKPRGIDRICEREGGKIVELRERRIDTHSALHYLAGRAQIDKNRIAVIGFSHGGMLVLNSLVPGLRDLPDPKFKAGVAIYPDCTGFFSLSLAAPLMILIGEKDDWTLASDCQKLITRLPKGSAPVRLEIYPGAHHAFDVIGQRHFFISRAVNVNSRFGFGSTVEHNPDAHERARVHVREFLGLHLAP